MSRWRGGKMGAFRILYQLDPEIPGRFRDNPYQRYGPIARSAKFDYTVWYAPDVRRIVRVQSSKPLLNFELQGAPPATAQAPVAAPQPEPPRPATPRAEPPAPKTAPPPTAPAPPAVAVPPAVAAPPAAATPPAAAAPLTIVMRHPVDGSLVLDAQTVVAAVVTSGRGVGSVTVSLNGIEVARQAERTPQPSIVVTAPVTLREGGNTIVLTAREPDGTVRQEVRTVTFERERSAARPAPPPPSPRASWAVIIGVGRYENPKIPSLRYAVADAEAVYNVLIASGFQKDNVLLLTDRAERKPTLRNMKYALGTFLARSAGKDDTVIVYFAGHGAPEIDPRGVEKDGLAKYLIPSDADPDDLFSTALPMDDLQTIFDRIEAERVVTFLDACYSGAGRRAHVRGQEDAGGERGRPVPRAAHALQGAGDHHRGAAQRGLDRAARSSGHGVFTYYLAEGLKGAGDLNRDGIVSLQELYEYVEQQVVQKSRAVGGNQHPLHEGRAGGRAAAHQSARAVGGGDRRARARVVAAASAAASCSCGRWDSWRACSSPPPRRSATSRAGRCAPSICSRRCKADGCRGDVVLVAVDRRGVRRPGTATARSPAQYLARVVRGLAKSGASVVGLDITFATPTTPEADAALWRRPSASSRMAGSAASCCWARWIPAAGR